MYNEQLEVLIDAALADGVLTEKEKQILFKKAQSMGIDLDEFEMVLDARLVKIQKEEKEKAAASAPKSTKFGDVRKCPVCGALLPALSGVCPECGFEFSGVNAVSSAQRLAAKLEEISDKEEYESDKFEKMATVVSSFPIPNTKADLLEFAISMRSKMSDKIGGSSDKAAQLLTAYLNKYKESIMKAKTIFPGDSMFAPMIASYDKDIKKAKKTIWWQGDHYMLWILAFLVALLVYLAFTEYYF